MEKDSHSQTDFSRLNVPLVTSVRSTSPSSEGDKNPFRDGTESQSSLRSDSRSNPFATPGESRSVSSYASSSALGRFDGQEQRYFHSRRVKKGSVEKPWLKQKDPKEKWITILPVLGILAGLGIAGFLVWDGIRSVVRHRYCEVLNEDFSSGLRDSIWTKEVELGGFGNGEFAMTTAGDENVFVRDGRLFIKATVQDERLVEEDSTIDLLDDGTCTSDDALRCMAVTNTTEGNSTIVPPAKSGRINTKNGASIKYGRIEVTAKLPRGDFLWPAIWMMPVRETYGPWPASGEIDIMESRGNNHTYPQGGNNIVSSALHWGPSFEYDSWWRTNSQRSALRTTYSDDFNVFGLEWSQNYLFTYVNTRLLQVMYTNFDRSFWDRGNFPQFSSNGTRIQDTWTETGRKQTPFDQEFYLILNLAVGAQNGWFENSPNKPWRDGSDSARKDFWRAQDSWLPTWTQPQMEISRVMMWQQCDGDEEL